MSSLKEIKSRIASVRNTQKITSAMRMVASAKLHHTQGMTEAFLRYKDELGKIVDGLNPNPNDNLNDNPNPNPNDNPNDNRSTLIVPVSSNSGLCGAFNSNIAKATMQRVQELESQGTQVRLLPIGKKITNELKKANKEFNADFVLLLEKIEKSNTFTDVSALVELANEWYQAQEINNVEFIYHHFKSMGSQVIQIDNLPLTPQPSHLSPSPSHRAPLTEPSPQELLTSLFPRLLNAQVYGILLDSLTSEHAARMLAMQTADDNANDLLKELTLVYNKTRQQAITNELIDIMGGQSGKH
ncbi:MAG: ATP synthase F1 subunit gamma [Bacteroidaceae bacterium]|nr:ATP synthase F1 subunit gamma [Bacteroidaceae bacterium]